MRAARTRAVRRNTYKEIDQELYISGNTGTTAIAKRILLKKLYLEVIKLRSSMKQ